MSNYYQSVWAGCTCLLVAISALQADPPQPAIRAGYAAVNKKDYNEVLLNARLNSAFWVIRPTPKMDFKLDENGRVYSSGIDADADKTFRNYASLSQEQGLDLYAKVGFFKENVEQLNELGSYHKAYVQGPTRYISAGEKPAPGPLEEKYWMGQLLAGAEYVARLSLEYPNIRGFLFDVEMYSGNIMWRQNSSFDDQTFYAVLEKIDADRATPITNEAKAVAIENRYEWLDGQGLLETYFSVQSQLVEEMAVRFRKKIHAINPDLVLGMMPFERNWFYDGWIRGLGTEGKPSLACAELEYGFGVTPTSLAMADYFKQAGWHARYLPGFSFKRLTPDDFANHTRLANQEFGGYWIFTTYSMWQPEPEKLWGPYLMTADRNQFIKVLADSHDQTGGQLDSVYQSDSPLITGNAFYPGSSEGPRDISVTYSVEPDVPFYKDVDRGRMFDGVELYSTGEIAWYADRHEEITVDIDLNHQFKIDQLLLGAAHQLMEHPRVASGMLTLSTSVDGKIYYPVSEKRIIENHDTGNDLLVVRDRVGVEARYIRIHMKTEKAGRPYSVWTVSELAVWGHKK